MSIVKLQPESPVLDQTLPTSTIEAPNQSIFTALVPESRITSLLKYVEGYAWTVDFYGQILNTNNTLENFDPSTPNLAQPYYQVSKLILQVASPLSSSYDQTTGITTITGSAITPYKITPNVGDVFIAQVDNGEDAIFLINEVSRKTHRKDTLYEINYTLYSYTSSNPTFIDSLQARVNETYYFNNEANFFNREVLIKPSVKEASDRLKNYLRETQEYYFSTFGQKRSGSILIPGLDNTLFDPLLLEFISRIVDYSMLIETPFYRHTYFDKYIDQPSIFDLLFQRSLGPINLINKTYNFLPSYMTANRTRFGTVYHSGIDYILYPTQPNHNTDLSTEDPAALSEFITNFKNNKNYNVINQSVVQTTNNNTVYNLNLLHELFEEDYYIVSKNFYDYIQDHGNYQNLSYIELLIYKFINKEAIAKEDLVVAIETYYQWSLLHQLYLLPVLWMMINAN